MIPWSVTKHCCFESSLLVFEKPILTDEAYRIVNGGQSDNEYKTMFETLDLTPEEETSLLQAIEATFG